MKLQYLRMNCNREKNCSKPLDFDLRLGGQFSMKGR